MRNLEYDFKKRICLGFGWPCVLIVSCLIVILVISHFGLEGGVWFLIAPFPVHCLLFIFSTLRAMEYKAINYDTIVVGTIKPNDEVAQNTKTNRSSFDYTCMSSRLN